MLGSLTFHAWRWAENKVDMTARCQKMARQTFGRTFFWEWYLFLSLSLFRQQRVQPVQRLRPAGELQWLVELLGARCEPLVARNQPTHRVCWGHEGRGTQYKRFGPILLFHCRSHEIILGIIWYWCFGMFWLVFFLWDIVGHSKSMQGLYKSFRTIAFFARYEPTRIFRQKRKSRNRRAKFFPPRQQLMCQILPLSICANLCGNFPGGLDASKS